jgi:hypothetical protein
MPAASIAPDLRFAAVGALADPGGAVPIGDMVLRVEGRFSRSSAVPLYLRYADRDAVIVADGVDGSEELETRLAEHIRAIAKAKTLDDLSVAVIALNAVDRCFRESGVWPGNIYLAGVGTLAAVLRLARDLEFVHRKPEAVLRELAALELAYLFPVAGKFRSGEYDGQVQYRLNGWGRALAARLMAGRTGAAQARVLRLKIGRHLASDGWRYRSFLSELDVARQDYVGNLLGAALALPIPVLV